MAENDMTQVTFQGVIQPALLEVKERFVAKKRGLNEESEQLHQSCRQLQEKVHELQQQRGSCVLEVCRE